MGALAESVKIPSRLLVLRRNGRGFHVLCQVRPVPWGGWVTAETTLPVPLGWDPRLADPDELRRLV
uniref:Uncharacterized protein n=2 Tax=viral metagenome TaxID=1070528 RepID=A0A6M3JQX1_9ZZZZ